MWKWVGTNILDKESSLRILLAVLWLLDTTTEPFLFQWCTFACTNLNTGCWERAGESGRLWHFTDGSKRLLWQKTCKTAKEESAANYPNRGCDSSSQHEDHLQAGYCITALKQLAVSSYSSGHQQQHNNNMAVIISKAVSFSCESQTWLWRLVSVLDVGDARGRGEDADEVGGWGANIFPWHSALWMCRQFTCKDPQAFAEKDLNSRRWFGQNTSPNLKS